MRPEVALAPPAEPLLELRGLARHFDVSRPWLNRALERRGRQVLRAVDGVDLSIARGSTFSLVGESGCGKSTLAKCVVGLHAVPAGMVRFDGTDIATAGGAERMRIKRRVQMVHQDPYASLNPRWRVRDIVAEPIRVHRLLPEGPALTRRVDELLTQVGLDTQAATRFPHEFSGGQRQRIAIARALSSEPDFIVCDEPTSALDVSVQAQILNLMLDLQAALGLTYLFISHNLAVVAHVSHRVGVMYLGRLVEVGDAEAVLSRPRHPYTAMLLDTLPDIDMTGRVRPPVNGELPNPINPPAGCGFNPRCAFANDRCRREQPSLTPAAGGSAVACHAVAEGRLQHFPFLEGAA